MPSSFPDSYTGETDFIALMTESMNAPKPLKKAKVEGDAAAGLASPSSRITKLKAAMDSDGEKPPKKVKVEEIDFDQLETKGKG